MQLITLGVEDMIEWVKLHRPACLPDVAEGNPARWDDLFPHKGLDENTGRELTANELLVELAGRKCYDSFGAKAGRKSNKEYIENTQAGEVPHASIMYHAKMSFFVAGISRRVSHEIIRNYVGADRSEEGNPSQESTRFTHHYGFFIEPPRYTRAAQGTADAQADSAMQLHFETAMQTAYGFYLDAVSKEVDLYTEQHGAPPTQMDRKRIYEAASSFLPHQAETSFIWTTNPAAIAKFVRERDNPLADLEIQRFARAWKRLCVARWPNLFNCYPWMQESKE
jgi:thymidylate synthase (FAD)